MSKVYFGFMCDEANFFCFNNRKAFKRNQLDKFSFQCFFEENIYTIIFKGWLINLLIVYSMFHFVFLDIFYLFMLF